MFYLHLSNKTENLIRQLSEVLSLVEDRDPFSPEYFLIQSQGMERMLSQQLAERFVSWCNYEYMLPTRFFGLIADRLGLEAGSDDYAREKVCWHLENILRRVDGEHFTLIRRYIDSDSNGLKRYQLARQLAAVFDQYQIMRPLMIDGWEQEKTDTDNSAEYYQMQLWNLLRGTVGHSRHRGVFLRDLIKVLSENREFPSVLPERLSVFGLHSLPPLLLTRIPMDILVFLEDAMFPKRSCPHCLSSMKLMKVFALTKVFGPMWITTLKIMSVARHHCILHTIFRRSLAHASI